MGTSSTTSLGRIRYARRLPLARFHRVHIANHSLERSHRVRHLPLARSRRHVTIPTTLLDLGGYIVYHLSSLDRIRTYGSLPLARSHRAPHQPLARSHRVLGASPTTRQISWVAYITNLSLDLMGTSPTTRWKDLIGYVTYHSLDLVGTSPFLPLRYIS
jgi:hypothetical protein